MARWSVNVARGWRNRVPAGVAEDFRAHERDGRVFAFVVHADAHLGGAGPGRSDCACEGGDGPAETPPRSRTPWPASWNTCAMRTPGRRACRLGTW